jgi:transposase InsO family protein
MRRKRFTQDFRKSKEKPSDKENPYDKAFAESFMKTLKSEEVHLWEYRTLEDVQKRFPYFIEVVYNQKRIPQLVIVLNVNLK